MKFESIRNALTAPLAGLLSGVDIVYPNQSYTPAARPFVQVFLLPNQPTVATLGAGGLDEHTGVLQLSLFYPQSQTDYPLLRAADAIEARYQQHVRGDYLTSGAVSVRINSIGMGSPRADGVYWFAPVNINYTAFIKGL
jgi:hypothetical protein